MTARNSESPLRRRAMCPIPSRKSLGVCQTGHFGEVIDRIRENRSTLYQMVASDWLSRLHRIGVGRHQLCWKLLGYQTVLCQSATNTDKISAGRISLHY